MAAPFVVVGAGECGVRASFALREAGYDGALILVGDEPQLPYERPPLSKHAPAEEKAIATEDAYRDAAIELRRGCHAVALDRHARTVRFDDRETIGYARLLLATGARPRIVEALAGARTLRTVDDARTIIAALEGGGRLVVIGGGFIGLELAATACTLGADAIVLEAADRLMGRIVPPAIADAAEQRHRALGVTIRKNAKVAGASANRVALADGETLEADIVVAGIGAVPNCELAQDAGLAVENGIVVDAQLRTDDPHIFAAGDCCTFPYRGGRVRLESWRAAQDHGNHVARSMLGDESPYEKVPWFWSDQHDLTLQVAGLPHPGARTLRRDLDADAFILFEHDETGAIAAASGIGPGNRVARDIRLAEMMIERGVRPDPALLADPNVNLKTVLRG